VADLFARARRGDESALPQVREALQDRETVADYGDLARHAQVALLAQLAGQDLGTQMAVASEMEYIRHDLAGRDPTPLEALLVDRVLTCWLHVHLLERRHGDGSGLGRAEAGHYQRSLSRAHTRYVISLKALAVVQRLAVPVLAGRVRVTPPPAGAIGDD
jgi:hypothetical protein